MKWSSVVFSVVLVVLFFQACFGQPVPGYSLSQVEEFTWGFTGELNILPGSQGPYGSDIETLTLQVYFQTEDIVRIKIIDPNNARWEVPDVVQFHSPAVPPPSTTNYRVSYTSSPFGIAVSRLGVSGEEGVIFNTTASPSGVQFNGLIYENQYLEISSQLPASANIYGLGERVDHFKLATDDQDYVMWNRDQGTPYDTNLYGTHPMYMEIRQSQTLGLAHGVFFLNTNAMNVHLQSGAMTFQTSGGVIDIFIVLGPSPHQVIQQYTSIVGRPHFPPFWEFGFHQCRWGYQSIQETASVALNYKRFLIPLDTMWNDIDYMDGYRDFTHDPVYYPTESVAQFVEYLHNNHQQYVVILDPGIMIDPNYFSYVQGLAEDVFIKESTGTKNLVGTVWPGNTVFPDFSNPKTTPYWKSQIAQFRSTGVSVDGLWIDMNEISNFCNGECVITNPDQYTLQNDPYDNPPWYPTAQPLNTSTISMNALTYAGVNYNTHDLYAFFEACATNQALEQLRGQRSFVLSRSSFAGSGKYTSCWLGDNTSDWNDMYYSIAGILSYQMFGITMAGVDICGFNGNTTEELCSRWMQIGAFYPFSRNHNSIDMIPQEPWAFDSLQHIEITRNALNLRYALLPYFYTLVYEAATFGGTIWNALIWEFPADPNCLDIDAQFLVGTGILVTPVLQANQSSVTGYFPADVWYDFYTGAKLGSSTQGSFVELDAPIKKIPIALRGGLIIPTQLPALTTYELRNNAYVLLVSLDENQQASGYVFLDDGITLYTVEQQLYSIVEFSCSSSVLSGKLSTNGYDVSSLILGEVKVFGVDFPVSSIVVNGVTTYHNFRYNPDEQILLISGLILPLASSWEIYWV